MATARIWNAVTGKDLRRFDAHAGVYSVQFSPDGRYILIGNSDEAITVWDVDYHATMQYLCAHLQRDLTDDERTQYGITDTTPTCPLIRTLRLRRKNRMWRRASAAILNLTRRHGLATQPTPLRKGAPYEPSADRLST